MQKQDIEQFKEKLLKLKAEIKRIMQSQERQAPTSDAVDEVDQATDMMSNMMGLAMSSNYEATLAKIEEALKRIENGEFGDCVACGKEIPIGRLEVLPFTLYCIDCQNEFERRRKNWR
ncbi:MAG: TraR/DksA family transcriptional regulator [Candidatus Omnitrophota bacterium]